MRLIDADRLKKKFCWHCDINGKCKEQCFDLDIIDTTPTIDAIPVVRCKECIYSGESPLGEDDCLICYQNVDNAEYTIPNGFCHRAEREEGQ